MGGDPHDLGDVRIRPATPADAQAITLAHLDSIRSLGPAFYPADVVEAWSAGLRPDIYVTAMDGGEAFFVATGTLDGELTVLGFSTHRVDDAQDGASVYVRGRAARRGIGTCSCGTRKITLVLMVPAGSRFRRRWPVSSFTKSTGSKNLAEERRPPYGTVYALRLYAKVAAQRSRSRLTPMLVTNDPAAPSVNTGRTTKDQ